MEEIDGIKIFDNDEEVDLAIESGDIVEEEIILIKRGIAPETDDMIIVLDPDEWHDLPRYELQAAGVYGIADIWDEIDAIAIAKAYKEWYNVQR